MARLRQYLSCDASIDGDSILLDSHESHHLLSVRRAQKGDTVSLFDGQGREWRTTLLDDSGKSARLRIHEATEHTAPTPQLELAVALISAKPFEWLIQKATELQVSAIVPLETERSEVRLTQERASTKLEKWRQITVEACKQSGNPFVPEISIPKKIGEYIASSDRDLGLVASLNGGAQPLRHWIDANDTPERLACAIGPEGDFTDEEYLQFDRHGWHPLSLGPSILRAETAALVAVSQLQFCTRAAV